MVMNLHLLFQIKLEDLLHQLLEVEMYLLQQTDQLAHHHQLLDPHLKMIILHHLLREREDLPQLQEVVIIPLHLQLELVIILLHQLQEPVIILLHQQQELVIILLHLQQELVIILHHLKMIVMNLHLLFQIKLVVLHQCEELEVVIPLLLQQELEMYLHQQTDQLDHLLLLQDLR
jgi:hypothetical protein